MMKKTIFASLVMLVFLGLTSVYAKDFTISITNPKIGAFSNCVATNYALGKNDLIVWAFQHVGKIEGEVFIQSLTGTIDLELTAAGGTRLRMQEKVSPGPPIAIKFISITSGATQNNVSIRNRGENIINTCPYSIKEIE